MDLCDARDIVDVLLHGIRVLGLPLAPLDVPLNVLADGSLAGPLADLCDVCSTEPMGELGEGVKVHIRGDWGLPKDGLEDLEAGLVIGEGDVDELIEASRPKQSSINDVRAVGSSDDEDSLLAVHAIHFSQQLIEDTVASSTSITGTTSSLDSNGIKLVKKKDAGCATTGLVKDLTDIGLQAR
jgi:hypothetical protein